jgi:hypothetical protein
VSQAHALIGQLALVLALIAAVWSIVVALAHRAAGTFFSANLIWVAVAVTTAAILGAVTAVFVAPPHDILHIVYGVLAVGTLPGAFLVATGRSARQQSITAAVATTVLVILLFRLIQTGG